MPRRLFVFLGLGIFFLFNVPVLFAKPIIVRIKMQQTNFFSVQGAKIRLQAKNFSAANLHFLNIHCVGKDQKIYIPGFGFIQAPLKISSDLGLVHINKRTLRDDLYLYKENSNCSLVNHVEMEDYLAGLLNKEMDPNWPVEALKAQAVAARSYALYFMQQRKQENFDLVNTEEDQVYSGADSETEKSHIASLQTKGMVLLSRGKVLQAFFHADCGGETELPESVWGKKDPAFRRVICPYHAQKSSNWQRKVGIVQLDHILKKVSGILPKNFLPIASVQAHTESSRKNIVVSDIEGQHAIIPANTFRNILGPSQLRSTKFQVRRLGDSFYFSGRGHGHGVGMCQMGAYTLAKQGKSYAKILAYFYPLAQLKRLY